jgi:hypothetical protein
MNSASATRTGCGAIPSPPSSRLIGVVRSAAFGVFDEGIARVERLLRRTAPTSKRAPITGHADIDAVVSVDAPLG